MNQVAMNQLGVSRGGQRHAFVKFGRPSMTVARVLMCLFLIALLATFTNRAFAQEALPTARIHHGLSLYEKFEGSSSAGAGVFDVNTTVGYDFTHRFGVDVGVPIYFISPPPASRALASQSSGIGDAYIDFRFNFDNRLFHYTSTPGFAFATGSTSKGFSTGKTTINWDNNFELPLGRFTPFLDVDPGNGVSNGTNPRTRVIKRPFLTIGKEVQFTGGTDVDIVGPFSVRADIYDVVPWGQQEILSRILRKNTVLVNGVKQNRYYAVSALTVGGANLVRDNGYDLSVDADLKEMITVEVGLDHSVHYAANTIFFSVGFDVSRIIDRNRMN